MDGPANDRRMKSRREPRPRCRRAVPARRAAARAVSMRALQPPAAEAGSLQSADDVRVRLHHIPDEAAAVVLDHQKDRALVDAEIVVVEPAVVGIDGSFSYEGSLLPERRVERVEESVLLIEGVAIARFHFGDGGNDELRSKRDRSDRGGRRDRAV